MPTDRPTRPWFQTAPLKGRRFLTQRSDLVLAMTVIAVIAMMLIPLPTFALDLLLTLNLSASVVLLLVGLYTNSPLGLSALPGLLLVTTLFRLALNISSTRLILLQADAGEVIRAFGDFVVQRNYVVGAVVFLILTLVQFLVIARGSERVAEVAARFTLDAMPGRQMAIDADLRAGALRLEEARQKRQELQHESQLYGAMDGAMKFVKGDAIAGLLITAINIIGGLAIGVFQHELPLDSAARTYTLLTIGDGLLSQIPALLIATSAGLIVTRVSTGSTHLGEDIAGQILAHPRALWISAALIAALGLVPGLPLIPFFVLAAFLAVVAWFATRTTGEKDALSIETASSALKPLQLALSKEGMAHLGTEGVTALRAALTRERDQLTNKLGIPIPPVSIVELASSKSRWDISINIDEIPALKRTLDNATPEALARAVSETVDQNSALLLGIQEVQGLLDTHRETYPADVEAVVPALFSVPELTLVLKSLLREHIPVRNLRIILHALAEHGKQDNPTQVGQIRAALKRQITHTFTDDATLHAWLVEREVEHMVRDAVKRSRNEAQRPSDLKLSPKIRASIQRGAQPLRTSSNGHKWAVVLTEQDIRPFLHALLQSEVPGLVTLAFSELTPDTQIVPLGRLSAQQPSAME